MERSVLLLLLLSGAIALLGATGLGASGDDGEDIVILKQGKMYKGKIISQTGIEVKIRVKGVVIVIKRSDIRKIILGAKPAEEYQKRAKQVGAGDGTGHYDLALWCRRNNLEKEAVKHFRAAIKADPDHAGAREALGFTRYEGRWLRAQELKKLGWTLIEGRWIEAKDLDEALRSRRAARLEQLDGLLLESEELVEQVVKGFGYRFNNLRVRGDLLYRNFQRDPTRLFVVREPFVAPLSLPALGQETCQALFDAHGEPASILEFLVQRGGGKPGGAKTTTAAKPRETAGGELLSALQALWNGAGRSCEGKTLADLKTACEKCPAPVEVAVADLIRRFTEAVHLRKKAFEEVVLEDLTAIVSRNEFGAGDRLLESYDFAREIAFLEGYPLLAESSLVLMQGAGEFVRFMEEPGRAGSGDFGKELFRIETPYGGIVVGGAGDDEYGESLALLIDLSGNDTYRAPQGSSKAAPAGGVSLLLDLNGDDHYVTDQEDAFGSGYFGIGIHFDMKGNDTYTAAGHSLGSAFVGCGLLYDAGGDDTYISGSFGQGCARFGYGFLIDGGGTDRYTLAHTGQGFGGAYGVGLLLDHQGDDAYTAGKDLPAEEKESFAQGAARGHSRLQSEGEAAGREKDGGLEICISGGWGILADLGGRDTYEARSFAQGASSWSGLGMLLDRWGDDVYKGTRCVQGAATSLSTGLLLDCEGDDRYTVTDASLGYARHHAVGALVDCHGEDHYQGGDRTMGSVEAMNCVGLFLDCRGKDHYGGGSASFGFAKEYTPLPDATYKTLGVFFDLGGKDAYQGRAGPGNDKQWEQEQGIGIGLDQEEG